ncbi:hypothetical protein HZY91_00025 [Facklamia sp. DSM 111018]|uniref:Apea-like HEPN domain-containing protein n=1 Tax=Facklamia lactis TaxID=2749967 RepID=A0ABS0LMA7_9LACT|nr:HEPN domain-containing protein [Facklamia lactis]MBG9985273.1 hypothetical protein [Facklamia lactis]
MEGIIREGSSTISNYSSFVKAQQYLTSTRKESFIPAKIANYISVLECLFAVKSNNTHNCAERVSRFIEQGDSRVDLYKKMKKIYGVRSSYVHGGEIKHSHDLEEYSVELDEIVRRVFKKFLTEFQSFNYLPNNSKKIDKYFIEVENSKGIISSEKVFN